MVVKFTIYCAFDDLTNQTKHDESTKIIQSIIRLHKQKLSNAGNGGHLRLSVPDLAQ